MTVCQLSLQMLVEIAALSSAVSDRVEYTFASAIPAASFASVLNSSTSLQFHSYASFQARRTMYFE